MLISNSWEFCSTSTIAWQWCLHGHTYALVIVFTIGFDRMTIGQTDDIIVLAVSRYFTVSDDSNVCARAPGRHVPLRWLLVGRSGR